MTRHETDILGFGAWMEIADDGTIDASFVEAEVLADTLTVITREREEQDGIIIPEETDVDADAWSKYWQELREWVSTITGISTEELSEHYHPDVFEPYLRYRP